MENENVLKFKRHFIHIGDDLYFAHVWNGTSYDIYMANVVINTDEESSSILGAGTLGKIILGKE